MNVPLQGSLDGRLKAAFITVFDLSPGISVDDLVFSKLSAWDSLGHMRLVAVIEQTFDISLELDDVINLTDYATAEQMVSHKLAQR